MSGKLHNKIAVVTGGTSGIGLATAKRFAAEGARVVVTGRRQPELDAAVAAMPGSVGIQGDSSKADDLQRIFDQIHTGLGRVDVLFVNAGGGSMLPLGAITEEHYRDTFDRNVLGAILTVQAALPLLNKKASVILTGSTAGISGTPAFSVYSASKAAIRALARSWILDTKDLGIRINVLSPGATRTPGLVELAGNDPAQQQGLVDYLAAQIPMGRVAEADEIASAALFLASDDASFVNGAELFADGGQAQI